MCCFNHEMSLVGLPGCFEKYDGDFVIDAPQGRLLGSMSVIWKITFLASSGKAVHVRETLSPSIISLYTWQLSTGVSQNFLLPVNRHAKTTPHE